MAIDAKCLPMMPIREVVVFPFMMVPFVVGRESSIRAVEEAMAADRKIFLAAQHDAAVDEPKPGEVFGVGTIANIVQSLKLPDGKNIKVLVEGVERARAVSVSKENGYWRATVETFSYRMEEGAQAAALIARVTGRVVRYLKLTENPQHQHALQAIATAEPDKLADTVAANLPLTMEEKQALLEIFDPLERLARVAGILSVEIGKLKPMDDTLDMLRHTVATLAYRGAKAMRGAPADFAGYRSAPDSRTPAEILAHMGDLFDWALGLCDGRHEWHDSQALAWEVGMARFFAVLEAFDRRLSTGAPLGCPAERIFQGPVADALTHVGQLAMLRRMAGCPFRGENYFVAEIAVGRVGADQAAPRKEF